MTKRDIIKWLEQKREEARENARQQYEEAMKQHNERLYKKIGLKALTDEIEGHLTAAYDAYAKWRKEQAESIMVTDYYTSSVGNSLSGPLNENGKVYGRMIKYDIRDETSERVALRKKYSEIEGGINRNYNDLILAVKNIKNAKAAGDYLKEVGFDVTNIEVKEEACTAIAANIDTRYLFIQPVER